MNDCGRPHRGDRDGRKLERNIRGIGVILYRKGLCLTSFGLAGAFVTAILKGTAVVANEVWYE